jgi:hypothetical protein
VSHFDVRPESPHAWIFLDMERAFHISYDGVAMIVRCIMYKTRGTVGQQSKYRFNLLTIIYLADWRRVPKVSQAGTVVTNRNIGIKSRLSGFDCNKLGRKLAVSATSERRIPTSAEGARGRTKQEVRRTNQSGRIARLGSLDLKIKPPPQFYADDLVTKSPFVVYFI